MTEQPTGRKAFIGTVQHEPTQFSHVRDRIDAGELKGCREGGQISTVFDKSD